MSIQQNIKNKIKRERRIKKYKYIVIAIKIIFSLLLLFFSVFTFFVFNWNTSAILTKMETQKQPATQPATQPAEVIKYVMEESEELEELRFDNNRLVEQLLIKNAELDNLKNNGETKTIYKEVLKRPEEDRGVEIDYDYVKDLENAYKLLILDYNTLKEKPNADMGDFDIDKCKEIMTKLISDMELQQKPTLKTPEETQKIINDITHPYTTFETFDSMTTEKQEEFKKFREETRKQYAAEAVAENEGTVVSLFDELVGNAQTCNPIKGLCHDVMDGFGQCLETLGSSAPEPETMAKIIVIGLMAGLGAPVLI